MPEDLQIIDHREFILSHKELASQPSRRNEVLGNAHFFQIDFRAGVLDRYEGTSVAYHKGILCGQSEDEQRLLTQAQGYYGHSNLAVFLVPKTQDLVEQSITEALGQR